MSVADLHLRDMAPPCAEGSGENVPPGPQEGSRDEALLQQFVSDQSEQAFSRLVSRHAGLVMGVCRRALGNREDAEDAFQATFLVLARKAATVRRGSSLSGWLYQTAHRIALRARAGRARRREQPLETEIMTASSTFSQIASEHSQAVLDEELNRLPAKYRLPLFLCCLEGRSREDAARQLDLSVDAVKGRVERGRNLLRRRLMLRGVSFSVVAGLLTGLQQSAQAAHVVSPALITSTVQAGVQFASGHSVPGFASQYAISLANRSVRMLSLSTARIVACSVIAAGSLAVTASWLPAPAVAGSGGQPALHLETEHSGEADAVAFLFDGEREGRPAAEGEGRRRSAEAEAGPGRSPEAEAGPRRSPEAEAGPRRSAEGERGARRSPEGERGRGRSVERRADNALNDFRPETPREKALYEMILQLQREMATIRREIQAGPGARDGEGGQRGPRDGEVKKGESRRDGEAPDLASGWERTKAGRVFKAYDKDGDDLVSLEEFLAMTNGNISDARREIQTKRFFETGPGSDKLLSPAEFIRWQTGGPAEGEGGARKGPRDGEGPVRKGPRDGEGPAKQGPRDGEGPVKKEPRDGEGEVRKGPRDGEGPVKKGPRDGE